MVEQHAVSYTAKALWPSVAQVWMAEAKRLSQTLRGEQLVAELTRQGLLAALAEYLETDGMLWAASIKAVIKQRATAYLAWHLATAAELDRLTSAYTRAGVAIIVLKGAALGPCLYPRAHYRMLGDIDLLIEPRQRDAAHQVLRDLGYRPELSVGGDLLFQARQYSRPMGASDTLSVDLHWRLSNRPLLAPIFGWPELNQQATAQNGALALGSIHALLHACMHRAGHHRDQAERLLWITDIHLLWSGMSHQQQSKACQLAKQNNIACLLLEALTVSRSLFATSLPSRLRNQLQAQRNEPALALLDPKRGDLWSNLCHQAGFRQRLRYLRQLAFPSVAYMRRRYATRSFIGLPFLYLKRAIIGLATLSRRRSR